MNEDHIVEPGIMTRIGWFFWRNWNRVVCATRGHDRNESACCRRCGLPPRTDVSVLYREALEVIGTECANYHAPSNCANSGRTRGACYTAEAWCDQCIAREALDG